MQRDCFWGVMSPSDPSKKPLKYCTKELAKAHADLMNSQLPTWHNANDLSWNREYWKECPQPWEVLEIK